MSKCGNFRVFVHVFAIGKGELARNTMHGGGVIPAGGSEVRPVANINTSISDTSVWCSKQMKIKLWNFKRQN